MTHRLFHDTPTLAPRLNSEPCGTMARHEICETTGPWCCASTRLHGEWGAGKGNTDTMDGTGDTGARKTCFKHAPSVTPAPDPDPAGPDATSLSLCIGSRQNFVFFVPFDIHIIVVPFCIFLTTKMHVIVHLYPKLPHLIVSWS